MLLVVLAACALRAPAPAVAADESLESAVLHEPVVAGPRLLSLVPVSYPPDVRQRGISGPVIVRARIGRDGRVRQTVIEHSIPELDAAALARVGRYDFAPATLDGREVETWVEVPVVFDESVPTGSHGGERYEPARYGDIEREFESDVAVLQDRGGLRPGLDDEALRTQVMQASLKLDVIPRPSAEAITAVLQGDTLANSTDPALFAARRDRWSEAIRLAPWWPLPYRRVGLASIAERDYVTSAVCARVILAGRPDDAGAIAMQRRARQLQIGEGRDVIGTGGPGKKTKK